MLLLQRSSTEVSFRVSSLKRTKSGAFKARKAIPASIRIEYQHLYGGPEARSGKAWEAIFSAPADTPVHRAKALHAEWLALVERRIGAIRGARVNNGAALDLSQRGADALAGEWYRWFLAQHVDNPGSASRWSSLREILWDRAALAGDAETGEADFNDPEVLAGLDIEARASQFLADRGISLSKTSRTLFLNRVSSQFIAAASTLERRAGGDWSVDEHMAELAPYRPLAALGRPNGSNGPNGSDGPKGSVGGTETSLQLFEAYCKDRNIKPSTIDRQRCAFRSLDGWLEVEGLTVATLDNNNAQRWIDTVVVPTGKVTKTIKGTWMAAPRATYAWAKRRRRLLITSNPFVGLAIETPRKAETRGKAFTDKEAATILEAALAFPTIPRTEAGSIVFAEAAHRWVPWMMAYTGARVVELTQARVCDVWIEVFPNTAHIPADLRGVEYAVLRITPDAGPVKNDKARTIPLHAHLVEQGLLDYVEAVRAQASPGSRQADCDAPLFNTGKALSGRGRGSASQTGERLAKWARSLSSRCPSLADKGVKPNHGWRHTFKQRARRAGIEPGIRDAICGHAPRSVPEQYEYVPVEDMAVAMRLFHRWPVGTE
jgi:integrase